MIGTFSPVLRCWSDTTCNEKKNRRLGCLTTLIRFASSTVLYSWLSSWLFFFSSSNFEVIDSFEVNYSPAPWIAKRLSSPLWAQTLPVWNTTGGQTFTGNQRKKNGKKSDIPNCFLYFFPFFRVWQHDTAIFNEGRDCNKKKKNSFVQVLYSILDSAHISKYFTVVDSSNFFIFLNWIARVSKDSIFRWIYFRPISF